MRSGACSCGRVRYQSEGEILFALICHCRDCQRASGSGGVPVMGVEKSGFEIQGQTHSYAVTGGSGLRAVRHFCPECGSLLFGMPEVAPKLVTIYAGSLDDPSLFQPTVAIFVRSRPAWMVPGCIAVEYDTLPEN